MTHPDNQTTGPASPDAAVVKFDAPCRIIWRSAPMYPYQATSPVAVEGYCETHGVPLANPCTISMCAIGLINAAVEHGLAKLAKATGAP